MGMVHTKGTCLLYVDSFVRGKGEISNFEFCSDRVFPMTLLELKGGKTILWTRFPSTNEAASNVVKQLLNESQEFVLCFTMMQCVLRTLIIS